MNHNLTIHEREDGNRYEAWAIVRGRTFSRAVYRDEVTGAWPVCTPDAARESVRAAAQRHEVEWDLRHAAADEAARAREDAERARFGRPPQTDSEWEAIRDDAHIPAVHD